MLNRITFARWGGVLFLFFSACFYFMIQPEVNASNYIFAFAAYALLALLIIAPINNGRRAAIFMAGVIISGMIALALILEQPQFNDYIVASVHILQTLFLLFAVVLAASGVLSFHWQGVKDNNIVPLVMHRLIIRFSLYGLLLFLLLGVFFLGWLLFDLLGIKLGFLLHDTVGAFFWALLTVASLYFLHYFPNPKNDSIPSWFLIFPALIVAFILAYVVLLPFVATPKSIDSTTRLSIAAILLFFLLYTFQPQRRIFNLLAASMGLLLIILSTHGVIIRLQHYPLTPTRFYALGAIVLFFIAYGLFFVAAWRQNGTWLRFIFYSSTAMLILMANSPILKMSVNSMVDFYAVHPEKLPTYYYQWQKYGALGEAGYQRLLTLVANDPEKLALVRATKKPQEPLPARARAAELAKTTRLPADFVFPPAIAKKLISDSAPYRDYDLAKSIALVIDANHDGQKELLFFAAVDSPSLTQHPYHLWYFPSLSSDKMTILNETFVLPPNISLVKQLQQQLWHYQRPPKDNIVILDKTIHLP